MVNRLIVFGLLLSLAFSSKELRASEWKEVVNLKGIWDFTVGDNLDWAKPSADISDWDQITVPDEWERYYEGYNGFAWYRKTFNFRLSTSVNELVLFLGYVDDIDEVYINGIKIGQSGKFPPGLITAWDVERIYHFPKNILKESDNVIAVRVYDERREGGIVRGYRIGIYYDSETDFLLYDLSGDWKFTTNSYKNIHSIGFDDSHLKEIQVPAPWESQGYEGHDGYGWYRKSFTLPDNFPKQNLYIVLGQIDEIDKVYLNGQLIGQTKDLDAYKEINIDDAYLLYRSYPIPNNLLKKQNVISVEVLDKYGEGGIYSGPVGIMNKEKRDLFMESHKVVNRKNFFQQILDYFKDR
ncbi:MAG: glycoside hydrolase [Prolixibacteraceae bacterium]|nr:glycoside hydrolase [Prolixibacteraceae bacterium]MBN2774638.1 glycoside hydrolase [Prolixibacteraceae bacterium]